MQVNRPSNIPGYGQGPSAIDRSGKDGQRKGNQGGDQPPKQPRLREDLVQLHGPDEAPSENAPKPILAPKLTKPKPGKRPPLDLSA